MTKRYVPPSDIARNIKKQRHQLDDRQKATLRLLEQAPLDDAHTVLDVGLGNGEISKWLARKGKIVTAIGLEISSYGIETSVLTKQFGISICEATLEKLPFKNGSFDAVVLSHVLEHCLNVGISLQDAKRVLKDGGLLIVFVPPSMGWVASGHVSVGWTVGQLMYVLLIAGFQVKDGRFFLDGERQVCAFVKKNCCQELPALRCDFGDIRILSDANLLPLPIRFIETDVDDTKTYLPAMDELRDTFWGNIESINWQSTDSPSTQTTDSPKPRTILYRSVMLVSRVMPKVLKRRLAAYLIAGGNLLREGL